MKFVPLALNIDVKNVFNVFIIFIKNAFFNVSYFFNVFLFSSENIFNPTKPPKLLHKTTFKWWI